MNQKRARSVNWDKEEKQLLKSVLKEYAEIIENKSLDTNSIKLKNKAWQEIHKKFNALNRRFRLLCQLKIQWKAMKIKAKKTYRNLNNANKTVGWTRPKTSDEAVIKVKDLLSPAELLSDENIIIYDSDGIISSILDDKVVSATTSKSVITSQEPEPVTTYIKLIDDNNSNKESQVTDNPEDSVSSMVESSEMLIDEHHNMETMEMAEEEDSLKMQILRENLKSAILKREILETKNEHQKKESKDCLLKMQILRENLRSAILEREILEIKKENVMKESKEYLLKMQILRENLKSAILERESLEMKKESEERMKRNSE